MSRSSFLAGELAAAACVSTDTLRHYERKGALPRAPRSANGYRRYPAAALERVRLIQSSLAIGFTLDELARIFAERDRGGTPCREVYGLAVGKLSDLDEQIRSLVELRKRLRLVVKDWAERLAAAGTTEKARLLESFSNKQAGQPGSTNGNRKLSPRSKQKIRR
ncbi:MAG TPA: MerR family transcriptional regulator [Pyrinomonadaceae bacterium]